MSSKISRRAFVKRSALVGAGAALSLPSSATPTKTDAEVAPLSVSIFSKHLQFLGYPEMAEAAATIGFDGIDLSVRPGGHVLPERVKTDLPLAVEAMRKAGFQPGLMTTAITDAGHEHTERLLRTAAQQGFQAYRLGYYKFNEDLPIPESLDLIGAQAEGLAKLNESIGIQGAYQNHSGRHVGAAIWDIHHMLKNASHPHMGCQYDIRHATVEGGQSWSTGLRLIAPRITSIVLKDFRWEQDEGGKWRVLNVPIGEGMVDFDAYFKWLKKHQINVPVSLHCEYDLGGAEHGKREISIPRETVMAAMKKDLQLVKEMWRLA